MTEGSKGCAECTPSGSGNCTFGCFAEPGARPYGHFVAEELCRCGHEHLRHDHGCIECRCRRFREVAP